MKPEGQKDVNDVMITEWGLWTQSYKDLTLTIERKNKSPAELLRRPIVAVDYGRSDLKVVIDGICELDLLPLFAPIERDDCLWLFDEGYLLVGITLVKSKPGLWPRLTAEPDAKVDAPLESPPPSIPAGPPSTVSSDASSSAMPPATKKLKTMLTVLDTGKPAPARYTKKETDLLQSIARGVNSTRDSRLMIFGTNEPALSAKNADDRHVGKGRDTLLALKDVGLVEIVSRDLWDEHMPFKSTLFTFENQTVLPIFERCDALGEAGKNEQVITVFILCRKLDVCITPSTLAEGEPGQQTNNSVAGMSAAIMAPKLALLDNWPHVLAALAEQGRSWESLFVFTNTHDPINGCTRCGAGPIGELCCPRVSMLEELSLQLLEHGKQNDGLKSIGFVGFSTTPGLVADRFASFFDAFSPAGRPDHPKFWRHNVEAMVQFTRSSADAMTASLLVLLEALEIADLPTCDEFARASYAKMVELKLRDTPRLGSLPEYDATRDFKADAKQRSIAASDSKMRFWNEQRRLKKAGLPNALNDEIAVLHLEEVDPPHRQDTVTLTKMNKDQMTGHFNPDKTNATRRRVCMPMATEHYFKEGDKIPKAEGRGRPPKDPEALKVLKVTIL